MILRALVIWAVIALAEVLHGELRMTLLNPRIDGRRARQIGVFTGSALILLIAWLTIHWIGVATIGRCLAVGAVWLALMLTFDIAFGWLAFRASWRRIAVDFDLRRGGLLRLPRFARNDGLSYFYRLKGRMTMLKRILHFVNVGIWEIHLKNLQLAKALPVKILRVVILAARGFMKNNGQKKASVLTYYSLLNMVPVIAVIFGVAKGFGFDKLIEKQILEMAEKGNWQSDVTNQIIGFSQSLLENVKGGLIAGVGVVLLFWTIISILGKIQESLNDVWEVRRPGTLVRKFSDYLAMMVGIVYRDGCGLPREHGIVGGGGRHRR